MRNPESDGSIEVVAFTVTESVLPQPGPREIRIQLDDAAYERLREHMRKHPSWTTLRFHCGVATDRK